MLITAVWTALAADCPRASAPPVIDGTLEAAWDAAARVTDFATLLRLLADAGVRFIIVGGAAATAHGSARLTQDLGVVYERSRENLERLVHALAPYDPYLRGAPPGLPFVFAMWIAGPDVSAAEIEPLLSAARDQGLRRIVEIAREGAMMLGISESLAVAYLRENLHFRLGPAERSGLARFHQLCLTHELIPPLTHPFEDFFIQTDGCHAR